jgi:hypothetical protein
MDIKHNYVSRSLNNTVLTVFHVERNEAPDGWDNRHMNEE